MMSRSGLPMLNVSRLDFSRLRALRRFMRAEKEMEEVPERSARVVCVASGKGGTGKSVVASNLATLRAARGERVCLVDFDAGLANAHLLLGVSPQHDLGHVMAGEVQAQDALVKCSGGLQLLSGGVGRPSLQNPTRKELERLFRALEPLERQFDLVLIDHGAGVGYSTVAHLAATSTLLIVTNHEVTALSDAYALFKRAHLVNPHVTVGALINRAPDEESARAGYERFRNASQRFLGKAPTFAGWVPYDEAVLRSVQSRVPVSELEPNCSASRELQRAAEWEPIDVARTASSFYERARRALR